MTGTDRAACAAVEPFALRVTDDSALPDFPRGCVVVVDPSVAPEPGAWAVLDEAAGPRLARWRPGEPAAVIGVVVQRAGRRRREHRRLA